MKADVVADSCRPFAGKNFAAGREVPLGKQNLLSSRLRILKATLRRIAGGIYFLQSLHSSSQWSQLSHCGFGRREK